MRIHVPETMPGTILALVKLINLTDDEVGAFRSLALIKMCSLFQRLVVRLAERGLVSRMATYFATFENREVKPTCQ